MNVVLNEIVVQCSRGAGARRLRWSVCRDVEATEIMGLVERSSTLNGDSTARALDARQVRGESSPAPGLMRTLEDTPFYVRSQIASRLLGEEVVSIHETLDVPRVVSLPVRLMLPWRMPRRP